jgi:orotate phosphoribosyltransferase
VVIGLDRQERGEGSKSAVQEVKSRFGIDVISIVGLEHIVDFLRTDGKDIELVQRIEAYRANYGVTDD